MSIKLRLQLIVFTSVVVTAISLVIMNIFSLNRFSEENIKTYKKDVEQSKIEGIRNQVQLATKIVESYYNRINEYGNDFLKKKMEMLLNELNNVYKKYKDNLSEDEIKELIKDIVEGARYGKSGYFWINDFNYKMVMHPIKKELTGKYFRNNLLGTIQKFLLSNLQLIN